MSEGLARCRKAVRIAAILWFSEIPSTRMVAATDNQWAEATIEANCAILPVDARPLVIEFLEVFEQARKKLAGHFVNETARALKGA